MTTTVLLRKSRSYLPLLKSIIALTAARLGMSSGDIDDAEEAVNSICIDSIDASEDNGEITVSINCEDNLFIVDISDSSDCLERDESSVCDMGGGLWRGLERAWSLADDVKVITRGGARFIRFVKRVRAGRVNETELGEGALNKTGVLV